MQIFPDVGIQRKYFLVCSKQWKPPENFITFPCSIQLTTSWIYGGNTVNNTAETKVPPTFCSCTCIKLNNVEAATREISENVVILNEWVISTLCKIQLLFVTWMGCIRESYCCYLHLLNLHAVFPWRKRQYKSRQPRSSCVKLTCFLFLAPLRQSHCVRCWVLSLGRRHERYEHFPTSVLVCRSRMVWITSMETFHIATHHHKLHFHHSLSPNQNQYFSNFHDTFAM